MYKNLYSSLNWKFFYLFIFSVKYINLNLVKKLLIAPIFCMVFTS